MLLHKGLSMTESLFRVEHKSVVSRLHAVVRELASRM